jgi:hypothetical protein
MYVPKKHTQSTFKTHMQKTHLETHDANVLVPQHKSTRGHTAAAAAAAVSRTQSKFSRAQSKLVFRISAGAQAQNDDTLCMIPEKRYNNLLAGEKQKLN